MFSFTGDIVLDPFGGTGSFAACHAQIAVAAMTVAIATRKMDVRVTIEDFMGALLTGL
jgi:hypothetical protein